MSQNRILALLLLLAVSVSCCFGQINFTPHWGQGKRALVAEYEDRLPQDGPSCLEKTDMNLLLEVAKLLAREAKRLSYCQKGCATL
uniref:Adipokinetic hormone n=1 Tax=Deroceras reticulatum TaxID=145610 RepID=A0A1X9ZNC7_DERRE|nr:adipokinetic hormone [Deroceras reticulatum]